MSSKLIETFIVQYQNDEGNWSHTYTTDDLALARKILAHDRKNESHYLDPAPMRIVKRTQTIISAYEVVE